MVITGIKIDLDTAINWWAPTKDALFLGVYSKYGGREFRLNGDTDLNIQNQEISLVLGTPCCKSGDEVQVQYAFNGGVNDPTLNPINLQDVEFVYLRKETADSTNVNDDQYKLDSCSVLLCDGHGGLRKFAKSSNINFSDEGGLQHWLREVAPPTCNITVKLKAIYHNDEAQRPAGYDWYFDFGFILNGNTYNILNDHYIKIKRKNEPDEWESWFEKSITIPIVGCCGTQHDLEVFGSAREDDPWPFPDDHGGTHDHHTISCNPTPSTIQPTLEYIVDGNSNRRKSKIKMWYEVTSVCVA